MNRKYYITLICLLLVILFTVWHLHKTSTMKEEAPKSSFQAKAEDNNMRIDEDVYAFEKENGEIKESREVIPSPIDDGRSIDKDINTLNDDINVAQVLEQLIRYRNKKLGGGYSVTYGMSAREDKTRIAYAFEQLRRKEEVEHGHSITYGTASQSDKVIITEGEELLMQRREERFGQAGEVLSEEYKLYLLDKYDGWTAEEMFWVYYKLERARQDDAGRFQEQYELEALSLTRDKAEKHE